MVRKRKDSKRAGKIIAVLIAVVMIGSIAGIMSSDNSSSLKYNGHKFKEVQYGYTTEVDGQEYMFYFLPQEVEYLAFDESAGSKLRDASGLLITTDSNTTLIRAVSLLELGLEKDMASVGRNAAHGFTEETENLPLITCDLADEDNIIIYIVKGSTPGVSVDGYCYTVTARSESEVIMLKDAIFYRILGIIE